MTKGVLTLKEREKHDNKYVGKERRRNTLFLL